MAQANISIHILTRSPPRTGERLQMFDDIQRADPSRVVAFIDFQTMKPYIQRAYREIMDANVLAGRRVDGMVDPSWNLETPPWAEGIPLNSKPWAQQHSRRYRKD